METRLTWGAVVVFLIFSGSVGSVPAAYQGVVSKVHDGDSVWLDVEGIGIVTLRLRGTDAPELKQEYGIRSRDYLISLVLDKVGFAVCHKKDKYKRNVCVLYVDNEDINLLMLKNGAAWHEELTSEQREYQRLSYEEAERYARTRRIGLWGGDYVEPWVFRRGTK